MDGDFLREDRILGSFIWYFYICHRQVWLAAHNVWPDNDNPHLELGRFLQEHSFRRHKKSIRLENMEIDLLRRGDDDEEVLVGEIKKSSWNMESAKMQLAFYMQLLRQYGIFTKGEVVVPKEKKRLPVELDEEVEEELERAKGKIREIVQRPTPPGKKWVPFCRGCGWREFCWSDLS